MKVVVVATVLALTTVSSGAVDGWRTSTVDLESQHEVVFRVNTSSGDAELERILALVSNPASERYGKYLSFSEVGDILATPSTAVVEEWLTATVPGVSQTTTLHGDYVKATAAVSSWNEILGADFMLYESTTTGVSAVRTPSAHVPAALTEHVTATLLTTDLPVAFEYGAAKQVDGQGPRHSRPVDIGAKAVKDDDGFRPYVYPSVLNTVYNITDNDGQGLGSQSVFENGDNNYSPADLRKFQEEYDLKVQAITKDIGGEDDSDTCIWQPYKCGEANLDTQQIMAVAQDVPTWFWSVSSMTSFDYWLADVANTPDAPLVHSVSYGQYESEAGVSSMESFNSAAVKLGTQGKTVVVSSGDDGVAGNKAQGQVGVCDYAPQWPATSPYVTTVGATQGPETNPGTDEIACSSNPLTADPAYISSGGGFSDTWLTQDWQADAVAGFFAQKNIDYGSGYNTKGRGYPDVALLGHNYPVYEGGVGYLEDGTSASTPVFAAMLSLINARRLAAGKSSVGFANPALYALYASNPELFNDITEGSNNCAAGNWDGPANCCERYGFHTTTGWDAVTGLGSVNFEALADAWVALD